MSNGVILQIGTQPPVAVTKKIDDFLKATLEKLEAKIAELRTEQRRLATKAAQKDFSMLPVVESESKIGLPS